MSRDLSPVFRGLLWGLLLALVALLATFFYLRTRTTVPPPPVLFAVPDFTLVDQHGETVDRADLLGQPYIANFIFTRCAGPCPLMTERLAQLGDELPAKVRRVSISVDPEYDTPEVLAAYAARYEAGPDWLFLTGDRRAIWELSLEGFKLGVSEAEEPQLSEHGILVHSTRLTLVDAAGYIRGYYDSFDETELARLVEDAQAVARLR